MRRVRGSIKNIRFATDWRRKHSNTKSFYIQTQIPGGTTMSHKSFIITKLFSPRESFNSGLPGIR
jgi:hypothetical protein